MQNRDLAFIVRQGVLMRSQSDNSEMNESQLDLGKLLNLPADLSVFRIDS